MNVISKINKKLSAIYSMKILAQLYSNWFNPLLTLYYNLVFFPFKQAIRFPLFVYGWPKLYDQRGYMLCEGLCRSGMIRFNQTMPFSPQAYVGPSQIAIGYKARMIFRGPCIIGTGNRIIVGDNGTLNMGGYSKIMTFCNITAYSKVTIGDYSRIVHRCQVLDTNFHFIANFNKGIVPDLARPISIGNYCWICNSATVSGGAVIPNHTIVASNSLVNKDMSGIAENSIIGGIPAKCVGSGYQRVESHKLSGILWKHYVIEKNKEVYQIPDDAPHSICDADYDYTILF